jgi:hypothetical protein
MIWRSDWACPYLIDCQLGNLKAETEKAMKALVKELDSATIEGP